MLAALLLAAGCTTPPALIVPGDFLHLTSRIEVLKDPDRTLSLADVTRAPACSRFRELYGQPNFGAESGGVWLRFRPVLPGDSADDWRLVVRFTGLEKVCVHWPLRAGGTLDECLSRSAESQPAQLRGGRLLFTLPAELDPAQPVHLYADSRLWLKVPLELGRAQALQQRETTSEFGWGIYHGLLIAFILVSLVIYLGRRDQAFLLFALHIAALTLALAIWQGRFVQWDPAAWSLTRLMPPLVGLFLMFGSRFYQQFLLTRRYSRLADRSLALCFWLALAAGVLAVAAPVIATRLLGPLSLLWLACVLWAAVVRARQRYWPALWVLAAVSVLLAAIFLNALSVVGLLLLPADITLHLAYIGNLIAAGFLVFGLVYRVRLLAEERDRATDLASANRNLALYRAHFDELTRLPNRNKFKEDVQERLMAAAHRHWALVTLGLDRFRALNHALGHEGGDGVLMEVAERLRQTTQPDDLLARIGAATFALLTELPPAGGIELLEQRCAALRKAMATPLLRGRGASLSLSIGVALYPEHAASADVLLRYSDEAFYRAREDGGQLKIFDPQYHQHAERYHDLNKDLRHALAHDELELHYQPLCSMDGGPVLGAEALLRWQRQGEDIPPDQFIPIAESSDLIVALTDWVFRHACRQARDWRNRGIAVPLMCVNVSATQFRLPGFVERVERALAEFDLPGDALTLEITESLMLGDMAATRETLARLRDRGVTLAVDDFGVGYSSLNYLRTLPVQSIKIDRSFLHGIPDVAEAVSVINAIIALGRDLGLQVIAEGVETQAQLDFLIERGVTAGQGYLMARPMPAAELEQWLNGRQAVAA